MADGITLWKCLQATPAADVRRRAAVVDAMQRADAHARWGDKASPAPTRFGAADRYAWNDGGGQSTVWYFLPDGRVLLTVFDHEEDLNLYAEGDHRTQLDLYDGVPDDLKDIVLNQQETYEALNIPDPGTGQTVLAASGVYWYDGTRWHIAEGLTRYIAEHHSEADDGAPGQHRPSPARRVVDEFNAAGFSWCMSPYLLGQDFTEETVLAKLEADGLLDKGADHWTSITREAFECLPG
ncbi:hypothetical protein [Streptomyces sp. DT171]|uniref:hypothetical protein n=1 Tax=Streptomyces sp. DT171 TaxID=3416524 RepID=UPI003CEBC979